MRTLLNSIGKLPKIKIPGERFSIPNNVGETCYQAGTKVSSSLLLLLTSNMRRYHTAVDALSVTYGLTTENVYMALSLENTKESHTAKKKSCNFPDSVDAFTPA